MAIAELPTTSTTGDPQSKELETSDIHDVAMQIDTAEKAYREHDMMEDPPTTADLMAWYLYSICSYFIHAVIIPVLFPLIIAQISSPVSGLPVATAEDLACPQQTTTLQRRLIHRTISVAGHTFSPLHWTAISWAVGIVAAAPFLSHAARHLDHGHHQPLILSGATAIGAFFCLLTGFFRTAWLFPLYITVIVVASTIAGATHTRHLGLMVRGFTVQSTTNRFDRRRAVSGWLSSHATAAGSAGATIFAAFAYNMLRQSDTLTGLWVVSIFSGIAWFVGATTAFAHRPAVSLLSPSEVSTWTHVLTIRNYPHAAGCLVSVILSSFISSCVFVSGSIYISGGGGGCMRPVLFMSLWMLYFSFPLLALPLLHVAQLVLRTDAVQMQLLGFLVSAGAAGSGFYFKDKEWHLSEVVGVALLHSIGVGVAHAFGRVLMMDFAPAGKEGVFSAWLEWARTAGACVGFAVAVAMPGDVGKAFGVSFATAMVGVLVLIFGNVSNYGGAVAAGHVGEVEMEAEGSPVQGKDRVGEGVCSIKLASEV